MNNKHTLIALGIAAAASFTVWHVGVSVNQTDLDSVDTVSTSQVGGVNRIINIDSDDETGFGLAVGRTLFTSANGNSLIAELSYANSDNDVENLQFMDNNFLASDGLSEGSLEVETILARVAYKFDLGRVSPYIGVGIGQSDLDVDVRYGGSVGQAPQSVPPFASGGDSATAIEFRVGADVKLSEQVGLFVEYSTLSVDDVEFSRTGGGPGGLATTTQSGDFDIESLNLGLKFHF